MTDDLQRLTTASNPVDAGALKAFLEEHGVIAHVQGEHHSSMLGQYGSFAIELHVLVPESQLERAHELLEVFRTEVEHIDEEDWRGTDGDDEDEDAAEDDDGGDDGEPGSSAEPIALKYDLRQVTLLSCFGFGLGHFRSGAYARGALLAAACVLAVPAAVISLGVVGLALWPLAIVTDVVGSRARVRNLHRDNKARGLLPSARLIER